MERNPSRTGAKAARTLLWTLGFAILTTFMLADPEDVRPWLDKLPGPAWTKTPPNSWQDWVFPGLATIVMVVGFEIYDARKRKKRKEQQATSRRAAKLTKR